MISPYIVPGISEDNPTIGAIKIEVCLQYGITIEEITKRTRERRIVIPRQMAVYITRCFYPGMTNGRIASYFGYTDVTTIIHCVQMIQNDIDTKEGTQELIDKIIKKVKQHVTGTGSA